MGICCSSAYWYWSMSTPHPKETCTAQIFDQEEQWQFLAKGILKKTCSARVCMTCQHFNYSSDKHCRTILSCHVHCRLIPHGEHLISRCPLWMRQLEKEIGWCLEVAWESDLMNLLVRVSGYLCSVYERYQLYWLLGSCISYLIFTDYSMLIPCKDRIIWEKIYLFKPVTLSCYR